MRFQINYVQASQQMTPTKHSTCERNDAHFLLLSLDLIQCQCVVVLINLQPQISTSGTLWTFFSSRWTSRTQNKYAGIVTSPLASISPALHPLPNPHFQIAVRPYIQQVMAKIYDSSQQACWAFIYETPDCYREWLERRTYATSPLTLFSITILRETLW